MKIYKLLGMVATVALVMTISSCGSSKPVPANDGEVEVAIPFATSEYQTDATTFRAKSSGQSPDMNTAKKIAMLNARTELAGNISSVVKAVTESYTKQTNIAQNADHASNFEETARTAVNQQLDGVKVLGEKVFKSKAGTYTYWVAIEMPRAKVEEGISNALMNDAKTKLEFDKFMFQKTFDEEMSKLENK